MSLWRVLAVFGAALNLADAAATLHELHHGIAVESNPIMAALYGMGTGFFVFGKLIVCALFLLLALHDTRLKAQVGIVVGVTAYVAVLVHHAIGVLT